MFLRKRLHFVAPKEQPPRKLSGKRTLNILTLERILSFTEGANLSGKKTDGAKRVNMKEKYIKINNLSISKKLLNFVDKELLPGTKIKKKIFGKDLVILFTS